jgi:hypothetical protein
MSIGRTFGYHTVHTLGSGAMDTCRTLDLTVSGALAAQQVEVRSKNVTKPELDIAFFVTPCSATSICLLSSLTKPTT